MEGRIERIPECGYFEPVHHSRRSILSHESLVSHDTRTRCHECRYWQSGSCGFRARHWFEHISRS